MSATDWMWCLENPKEAAAEIDRLKEENFSLRLNHGKCNGGITLTDEPCPRCGATSGDLCKFDQTQPL